jgi:RNA-binding protein
MTRMDKLPGPEMRKLKSMAQLLEPVVMVGKNGLSAELMGEMEKELNRRELIKVKFSAFKDRKKEMSVELAGRTGSHLVMRVGHVAVFFRRNANPEKQVVKL